MTGEEKKMKRYTTAVERRLNLPREIRNRVMSDFISSISARREAGMSDEEIYAELGSPPKAAAELNEQMKEFTYRKSPWRYLFAACAAYGGAKVLHGLWVQLVLVLFQWRISGVENPSASIGIIGGADGPTAIFVTGPVWMSYVIPAVLLAVGIWGFWKLSRCKKQ